MDIVYYISIQNISKYFIDWLSKVAPYFHEDFNCYFLGSQITTL